jgi:hypothetical protein
MIEENPLPLPGIESQSPDSLYSDTILTELPELPYEAIEFNGYYYILMNVGANRVPQM